MDLTSKYAQQGLNIEYLNFVYNHLIKYLQSYFLLQSFEFCTYHFVPV